MVKIWQLGLVSFETATKIQQVIARKHLDAMLKGLNNQNFDTLLLLEHKPIYTVGIRDETPYDEIARFKIHGADFSKTNRGGLITFHGPGQLVAYPILNLKHFRTSVKWYVNSLEEAVISMCEEMQIKANRSKDTGVWVNDNKLAAIGIHASRYVTSHGVAINCNNDLSWFEHIDPCGIPDKGVTSLTNETDLDCTTQNIIPLFVKHFEKVFQCETNELEDSLKQEYLNKAYNKISQEDIQSIGSYSIGDSSNYSSKSDISQIRSDFIINASVKVKS